jgi:energy-coupling factor transporter ATP-binding protein EcfA2
LPTPTAYARARTLLERVGLSEKVDSYPGQLSGGEQRRAAIARALINSPALLLADEPTADLDEETEQEILELLINIQRLYGFTMIVVTNNPAIARRANRIMEMRKGEATEKPSPVVETEPSNAWLPSRFEPLVAERAHVYDPPLPSTLKQPVPLGKGVDQFIGSLVKWVTPMVFLAWAVNWGAAWYQRSLIEARIAARSALEQLAMTGLRADLQEDDLIPRSDNYYVYLKPQNADDAAILQKLHFDGNPSGSQCLPTDPADLLEPSNPKKISRQADFAPSPPLATSAEGAKVRRLNCTTKTQRGVADPGSHVVSNHIDWTVSGKLQRFDKGMDIAGHRSQVVPGCGPVRVTHPARVKSDDLAAGGQEQRHHVAPRVPALRPAG